MTLILSILRDDEVGKLSYMPITTIVPISTFQNNFDWPYIKEYRKVCSRISNVVIESSWNIGKVRKSTSKMAKDTHGFGCGVTTTHSKCIIFHWVVVDFSAG